MYNITDGDKATPGNELGIFEDLADYYSQQDLDLFFSSLATYVLFLLYQIQCTHANKQGFVETSRTALTRPCTASTVVQRQQRRRLRLAQSQISTSRSRIRSSGPRTRSCSRRTTPTTKRITPLRDSSTTSSMPSTARTARTRPMARRAIPTSTRPTRTRPRTGTRASCSVAPTSRRT